MDREDAITRARQTIRDAHALIITAGAGMGVDSGLPDFRGDHGFWNAYPPIARLGLNFYEMANPRWFHENPRLAWGFYGHRLNLYRNTIPHPGFQRLLEIGREKPGGYFVFTSNVDGQFQKAGFSGEHIEECHGSIHYLQCSVPCCQDIWPADDLVVEIDPDSFLAVSPLPECPRCGAVARPNILMFGDWSWISIRADDQSDRMESWLTRRFHGGDALAVIEIGAGEAVPTVRMRSEYIAHQDNVTLIRINPREYAAPHHLGIAMGGAEGIAAVCSGIA